MSCIQCKRIIKDQKLLKEYQPTCQWFNHMKGNGNASTNLMFVDESPGAQDCETGKAFNDKRFTILKNSYFRSTKTKRTDFYYTYAIKCRLLKVAKDVSTWEERKPTPTEFKNCKDYLFEEIKEVKPRVVVAFGATAWKSLTGMGDFGLWEGRKVWQRELGCWIVPLFNMAHIMQLRDFKVQGQQLDYFKEALALSRKPLPKPDILKKRLINSFSEFDKVMILIRKALREAEGDPIPCVVDIETEGLVYNEDKLFGGLLGIGLCWKAHQGVYVTKQVCEGRKWELAWLMKNELIEKIVHNSSFDIPWLEKAGFPLEDSFVWDTLLMSHIYNENIRHHDLKSLAWEHTYWGGYDNKLDGLKLEIKKKLKKEKSEEEFHYGMYSLGDLYLYCCYDVVATYALYEKFRGAMRREGTEDHYEKVIAPLRRLLDRISEHGILIDKTYLHKRDKEYQVVLDELLRRTRLMAAKKGMEDFNLGSPGQRMKLLYGVLKLPKQINRKTKRLTTDAEALEVLKEKHIIPYFLAAYNKLSKDHNSYVKAFIKHAGRDRRVHTSFIIEGARTGRISSRNPSCQNVPKNPHTRNMIIAPKGWRITEADYSQAELRWTAHYSQDPFLLKAYNSKVQGDIHTLVASEVEGIDADKVTSEQRNKAKTVNFGLIYGRGASGLAGQFGITLKEAEEYIGKYFARLKGVHRFIVETKVGACKKGYVESFFGRRRHLPELKYISEGYEKERLLRQAVNSLVQGSAADNTYVGLLRVADFIKDEGLESRIILTVHDSIVLESPVGEAKEMAQKTKELMEVPIEGMTVKMVVDTKTAKKWGVPEEKDKDKVKDILEENTVQALIEQYKAVKRQKG